MLLLEKSFRKTTYIKKVKLLLLQLCCLKYSSLEKDSVTFMETATPSKPDRQEILTLEEIIQRYPNQWVLIVDPELNEDLEVIRGQVVASAPHRDELYDLLGMRKGRPAAIEYTGSTADVVAIPFL